MVAAEVEAGSGEREVFLSKSCSGSELQSEMSTGRESDGR